MLASLISMAFGGNEYRSRAQGKMVEFKPILTEERERKFSEINMNNRAAHNEHSSKR